MGAACISISNRQVAGTPIISEEEKQETVLLFVWFAYTIPEEKLCSHTNNLDEIKGQTHTDFKKHRPLVWNLLADEDLQLSPNDARVVYKPAETAGTTQ